MKHRRQLKRNFAIALAMVGSMMIAGCATNPVTGKQDFVLMSEQQEIELGREYNQQVMKQYRAYDDPKLSALVKRVGQELAHNSHRPNLKYEFTLLDSPEVNAFALPGGYIYITRGIIAYMNNEEQLAGVLGHEIGHVTARHSVRQQAAATTAGLLGAVATIATGSQSVGQLSNTLGGALVSGYGRSHELEADRLGAEYLARAGYDPQMMLGVIGILKDQEEFEIQRAREENRQPQIYHGLFASHPKNDQRLQEVVAAADKYRNPEPRHTDPQAFLQVLEGMTFGHSEDQGIVRGNRFYHKALDFTMAFPEGWRVDNQPDQLVAVSGRGDRAFLVRIDNPGTRETPSNYLRRNFGNLSQVQRINDDSAAGLVEGKNPFGTTTMRVAAASQNNRVFVVYGAARSGVPGNEFFETVRSIRRLNPDERALASARHIDLIRTRPGDTFAKLAQGSGLGHYAEAQLRLLNGMYPDGEPAAGQLIKVVR